MKGLSGDSEGNLHGREASSSEEESHGESTRACPACGARARRAAALFCSTCGQTLGGGYFPTDSLRASYRFERPRVSHTVEATRGRRIAGRKSRGLFARKGPARAGRELMPRSKEGGGAASLTMAFVTYSLVPYLGILFCPGALLCGGIGLVRAWRSTQTAQTAQAARASALGLALGLLVLCAQLLLWWILYKVPEWARGAPF